MGEEYKNMRIIEEEEEKFVKQLSDTNSAKLHKEFRSEFIEILSERFPGIRLSELTTSNHGALISALFTEHHPVFAELKLTNGDIIVYSADPASGNFAEQKVPPELRLIVCNDADDLKSTLEYQDPLKSPALLYVNGMDPNALRNAIKNSNLTAIKCIIWVNSSNIPSLNNLSIWRAYKKSKRESEILREQVAAKAQEIAVKDKEIEARDKMIVDLLSRANN